MTKTKLIDSIQIGQIEFEAYIIQDENDMEAFAIYFQKVEEPLILFQQISNNYNVKLKLTKN